ncbi:MAG: NAD(P)-dependent alcohol dehydrogenase [Nocardioides sp.]|uniref:NAD(P)-dependent alcohol dehydrogenase n=1 Tax=Nocardioides sp. TaxID=35761 RepID=UPI003F1175CC
MKTTIALSPAPQAPFDLVEADLDEPRDDEVLVRIVASGLCHTDVSVRDMLPAEMFPRVFGHEGAGVVEKVGAAVSGIEVGDHVVLSFDSCGACERCRAGEVGYCESTMVLNYMGCRMDGSTTVQRDGQPVGASFFGQSSFATYALTRAQNTVVVDKSHDLTRIAPYGCGFQTGAGAVLNVLQPGPGDSLVVYGAGAVGMAALAAAKGLGVTTLVAVDLHPGRLETAARLYGAVGVRGDEPGEAGLVARIKELTAGGATHAVETTGVAAVFKDATLALGIKGTVCTLALGAPELTFDAIDLFQNGKSIRGTMEGESNPQTMVPRLLELAAAGKFEVDELLTAYPFSEINTALTDSLSGATIKPVVVMD